VYAAWLGAKFGLEDGCLRDLSEARLFPEDLFLHLGATELPEEHEAGVIFGATLWRLRTALKQKQADAAIAESMFEWPQSNAEAGFPVVDLANAEEAYAAFYAGCLSAVLDGLQSAGGIKLAGKALGPVLANGAVGSPQFAAEWIADLSGGGKLAWKADFLGAIDAHRVGLLLTEGQTLSVSVKGGSGTQVDFLLDGHLGGLLPLAEKKVNAAGTSATQKDILVTATDDYTIMITLTNAAASGGKYKATVTVKN
jgi:hypothetical protein